MCARLRGALQRTVAPLKSPSRVIILFYFYICKKKQKKMQKTLYFVILHIHDYVLFTKIYYLCTRFLILTNKTLKIMKIHYYKVESVSGFKWYCFTRWFTLLLVRLLPCTSWFTGYLKTF